MQKILAIILAFTPFFLIGQVQGDFTLRVNYGMVFDENHPDLDIDEHSPDFYSGYNDRDDVKNALKLSGGYYFKDKLLFGLSYMNSEIAGSNDIEFWEGEFTETSLFAEYEIFEKYGLGIYATGGGGRVSFDAFRSLMLDGGQVPLNSYSGSSIKYQYGGGINYLVNDFIKLNLELSRNTVTNDGFDGWDYGSGQDRYLYKCIGISFFFGGPPEIPEIKEIIEDSVVIEEPVKIVEDTIEVIEEVIIEKPVEEITLPEPVEEITLPEPVEEITLPEPVEEITLPEPVEYKFTIFFDSDSDLLSESSVNKIAEIYQLLSNGTDYTILLAGHCDTDGTESYNLALSERRTTRVFNKLLDSGISADTFNTVFYGESNLLDDKSTEEGKVNNRVVTVQFTL